MSLLGGYFTSFLFLVILKDLMAQCGNQAEYSVWSYVREDDEFQHFPVEKHYLTNRLKFIKFCHNNKTIKQ